MKNVRNFLVGLFTVLVCTSVSTASVNYNDVAVIVNSNSASSKAIAAYFQTARAIPAVNMISIDVPEQEEIDSVGFASLRSQVESYLTAHNLVSSINYLVTTKGVPLKVNREPGGGYPFSCSSRSSSVESDLMLILGSYSSSIGGVGRIISPYYNKGQHFSRSKFGVYLVTRLDGYTVQDVENMIDRAVPGLTPDPMGQFVFDQDPAWNSSVPYLNTYMSDAYTKVTAKGCRATINRDSVFLTHSTRVLGYTSWGSNDHYADLFTQHAIPGNTWAPGGIAETYVSSSARSFASPPSYGQSLIADLVKEGASGAKGYVYEPFSSAMSVVSILYDSYTSGYNLAESYYLSTIYISWMEVVIGDPKVSIDGVGGDFQLPVQLSSFVATQTPGRQGVLLQWATASESNNYGFRIQHRPAGQTSFTDVRDTIIAGAGTSVMPHEYSFTDHDAVVGRVEYRLKQVDLDGSEHYSEPIIVEVQTVTGIVESAKPVAFSLHQNFPNPFNPMTTIDYSIGERSRVTLVVYSTLGAEVARLVDGIQEAGQHRAIFSASAAGKTLASGVYFCRLQTERFSGTVRMILAK